jgi:uncharacterized membrane protein
VNFLTAYWPLTKIKVVLILATLLRVVGLGVGKLWYDETGTVWMATLPFDRLIAATGGDVHPPLYLALMWAWVRVFGVSEFVVRVPSLIFSVASIYLLYKLALKFGFAENVATAAAILMAVVPAQLHYAQEARMYALLEFEFLLALWFALSGNFIALGVTMGALALTQNYGVMFAGLAFGVALIAHGFERSPRKFFWLACGLIVSQLIYAPWVPYLRDQLSFVGAGAWWAQKVELGSVLYVIYMMVWTFSTPDALAVHAALLAFASLMITAWLAVSRRDRPALIVLVLALTPIMLAVVVSVLFKPILIFRALLPISPLLLLALAWAFMTGTSMRVQLAISLLVVPVAFSIIANYYLTLPYAKGNPQQYANVIDWQSGDVAYYADEGPAMMMHFYRPTQWAEYVMPPAALNMGALTDATRNAMGMRLVALDDLQWRRAWLFNFSGPTTAKGQDEAVEKLLAQYTHVVVYESQDDYTHTVIYLLFNHWVGVQ